MAAMTRWLRRAFTGGAIAWAAAIPAATFLAEHHATTTFGYLFAVLVYAIGSVVCHQLPERSFDLWGRQLPVCARCTGIYIGAAIAVAAHAVILRTRRDRRTVVAQAFRPANGLEAALKGCATRHPETRSDTSALLVFIVAALPTAATLVFEWTTGVMPANWVRAVAGLTIGGAGAWLVARGLAASPEVN
jgi:hypothetical protein